MDTSHPQLMSLHPDTHKNLNDKIETFNAHEILDLPSRSRGIKMKDILASKQKEFIGDYVFARDLALQDSETARVIPVLKRGKESIRIAKEVASTNLRDQAMTLITDTDTESVLMRKKFTHPNIALPIDRFRHKSDIVRIYYAGSSDLEKYLARNESKLTHKDALSIVIRIAQGVRALHKENVVHSDIAPLNIILTRDNVQLIDLETAVHDSSKSGVYKKMHRGGNRFALPPEMYVDDVGIVTFDQTVDIYQLSALLYRLIAHAWPYDIEEETKDLLPEEKRRKYAQLHALGKIEFNESFPENIKTIVSKGMQPSPDMRYQSVDEFLSEILKAYNQL